MWNNVCMITLPLLAFNGATDVMNVAISFTMFKAKYLTHNKLINGATLQKILH